MYSHLLNAAIAQLDRASDYGSEGLRFDSSWLHHSPPEAYKRKIIFCFFGFPTYLPIFRRLYQNLIAFGLFPQRMFETIDWSRGARPPSRAQPRASRGGQKMRPKAGGISHIGRGAHPTAPGAGAIPETMPQRSLF